MTSAMTSACCVGLTGHKPGVMSSIRRPGMLSFLVVISALIHVANVEGLPFPATDFGNCKSVEGCCDNLPNPSEKSSFRFQSNLPMRTRRAAHLVDDAYIAKYQKAYELMKALPDTDGRSFHNQKKLHCLYCDNSFFFSGNPNFLEIHNSWLFLPWHRLYLYFHERILAKLLGDDTFALPFWNWDDQSATPPLGNIMPYLYADKTFGPHKNASFVYDGQRNACNQPPAVVDYDPEPPGFCTDRSAVEQRIINDRLLYTQLVTGATTPTLFFGQPYRFGDVGAVGGGTLEARPHGQLHPWISVLNGHFKDAAGDPLFFALHGNVDRMWQVWKTLPGGNRNDLTDPDWLNSRFTFYDEDGKLVSASVAQSLDTMLLRYTYQEVRTPSWAVTNGKSIALCNSASPSEVSAMIQKAPTLAKDGVTLLTEPLTFKVTRPYPKSGDGEEVLVFDGIRFNWTEPAVVDAYLYFPTNQTKGFSCPEWIGMFLSFPHAGMPPNSPTQLWRIAIGAKLRDMNRESFSDIVVTLVQRLPAQAFQIKSAQVTYFNS